MRNVIIQYFSKNGIRFHHSISTYTPEEEDSLKAESHYMCEFFLLLSGSVSYNIEGTVYYLSPLNALVIPPNKLHTIQVNTNQPYERMVLHFSPNLLPSFQDFDLLSPYKNSPYIKIIPKRLVEEFKLLELMNECKTICQMKNKYQDLHLVRVMLRLIEALNEISLKQPESQDYSFIKTNTISHACIQYINENLTHAEKLLPQNIAQAVNISLSHLRHTFKKEIGITLHSYIFNQRMQFARTLLIQGKSPQFVAYTLGYEYYSTFYHNYVKRFGISPNEFIGIEQMHIENIDV